MFKWSIPLLFVTSGALAQATQNPPEYADGIIQVAGGTLVTTNLTNARNPPADLVVYAMGPITTWDVILPPNPYDGQNISFGCPGGTVTTLSVFSTFAIGSGAPSSCTAGSGILITYQFSSPTLTWIFRSQTGSSGGGGGGTVTAYANHAALIAAVTAPLTQTLTQAGFTTAGDDGAATYQWSAASTCPANIGAAGDGIFCILPSGQSSGTPGRYLMQYGPPLDVRQAGLQAGGTVDNAAAGAAMLATVVNAGQITFPAQFPTQTTYYFSSPLNPTNNGLSISCGGVGFRAQPVQLLFAAGVDGIEDGGISNLDGCEINSQGRFTKQAPVTVGDTSITNVGAAVSGSPFLGVGDGIIVKGSYPTDPYMAVAPGETVSSVSGTTIGLTTPITGTGIFWTYIYRLPVALMDNVTTTSGSNIVTVTGGTTLFHSGDIVWSDAFPFGTTVGLTTGTVGAQTLTMYNMYLQPAATANATVTHAGGTGKMWRVPAGLRRWGQGKSNNIYVANFPVGLSQMCNSSGGLNCTGTLDKGFGAEATLIGRLTAGNNSGGSQDIAGFYANNLRADIAELGTVGTYYAGTLVESGESNTGTNSSIIKNCMNPNYSMFWGVYNSQAAGVCADSTDPYGNVSGGGGVFFGGLGNDVAGAINVDTQGAGLSFAGGQFTFTGNGAPSSNCALMGLSAPYTQYILSVSATCGIAQAMSWVWDVGNGSYDFDQWVYGTWETFPIDTLIPTFPNGLELNTYGNTDVGLVDEGSTSPTIPYRVRGNLRVNSASQIGGPLAWTNALAFSTNLTTQAILVGQTGVFTASMSGGSTMAVTAFTSGSICVGGTIGGVGVSSMQITTLPSGNTWGCSNATGNYTLNSTQTFGSGTVTSTGQTAFSVAACPSVALTGSVNVVDASLSPVFSLGSLTSCTPGSPAVVVLSAVSLYASSGTGDALQFVQASPVGTVQDIAAPVISSCGTSPPAPAAGSNNLAGQFTMGTGTPTACTVTFAHAYPNVAFCTVTPASSGGAAITGGDYLSAMSASGFTWTLGTGTSSLVFDYNCGGN